MLVLLISTALVAATAVLLAASLAEGGVTQLLVGAYVIAFAEIVLVSLLVSLGSALTRWVVLGTLVGLFSVALLLLRRVRFPPVATRGRSLRKALSDPSVALVATVVVGVIVYSAALALLTPPNDEDALGYHLARAAFWRQQEAVGYIDGAEDIRLNTFAPNSEIAMGFTMVMSGTGRYAPLVQLIAAAAAAVAVFGISRRIGLGLRASLLGGLLFVTLPVVALQASTGLNDIVVASLVAASAFFLLRGTWSNLALASLSVVLLIGTKLTGVLALPGLALIAIVARRHRPWLALAVLAVSSLLGAYWYAFDQAKTGDPSGGIADQRGDADPVAIIGRVTRLALATIELPGAIGLDRLLYVAAALLLAIAAVVVPGRPRDRVTRAAIAASATLAPLALVPLGELLLRADQKLFFELGRPEVGYLDSERSTTKASPIFSWYGPLGVVLFLVCCGLVIRAIRRRQLPPVALVLAAAPALWLVLVAASVSYTEWNGRYAMGGYVLAAATWGIVLSIRPLAWAAAAMASLTVTLAFVHLHDRPSGLRLLEPTAERSVWSQPDWMTQATDRRHLRALFRFAERNVPRRARLALEPNVWPGGPDEGGNLLPFPFFGPSLSRTVLFATSLREAGNADAQWAILRDDGEGCVPGWKTAFRYDVWIVARREDASRCD